MSRKIRAVRDGGSKIDFRTEDDARNSPASTEVSPRQNDRRRRNGDSVGHRLLAVFVRWEAVLVVLLAGVFVLNSNLSPYFLNRVNLLNATYSFMERAIMAMPMMLVIISGEIDISVAGIIALSSTMMGLAAQAGAPMGVMIAVALATGLLAGLLNAFIVLRFRVPSIAVTIGSMSLFRGISWAILGNQALTGYPRALSQLGQGTVGNTLVPMPLVMFALLAAVTGVVLHRTAIGRSIYALGSNPTATLFSGVPVTRYKATLFALNGLVAGFAAVLLTSRILSTRPNIAMAWELEVVTLVVLGGVAITGGKGTIVGVVLSIFVIGYLRFGLTLINVPSQVIGIVTGLLLVSAIILPGLFERLSARITVGRQLSPGEPAGEGEQ